MHPCLLPVSYTVINLSNQMNAKMSTRNFNIQCPSIQAWRMVAWLIVVFSPSRAHIQDYMSYGRYWIVLTDTRTACNHHKIAWRIGPRTTRYGGRTRARRLYRIGPKVTNARAIGKALGQ